MKVAFAIIVAILVFAIVRQHGLKEADQNPVALFGLYIALAIVGASVMVKYILPMLGNFISSGLLGSGDEVDPGPADEARSLLAQGDYEGAIAEFQTRIAANPGDRMLVSEVAKIYRENLKDPDGALATINSALRNHEWEPEDKGFLLARVVEINEKDKGDMDLAKQALERMAAEMDGTRFGANAKSRLRELG